MVHLEKRDRGIMCFVIFLFAFQFIAISYVSANVTGWGSSAPVTYNITDESLGFETFIKNGSSSEYLTAAQTEVYDNDTGEVVVPSLSFADKDSPTAIRMRMSLNTTFLADVDLASVVFEWAYVGTGNLTQIVVLQLTPTPTKTLHDFLDTRSYATNGSLTWTLESFEVQSFKLTTSLGYYLYFMDSANLPTAGDVISVTMSFYTSTMLLTQTQILQGMAGGIGVLWFVIGAGVSPFWNPTRKRSGQR